MVGILPLTKTSFCPSWILTCISLSRANRRPPEDRPGKEPSNLVKVVPTQERWRVICMKVDIPHEIPSYPKHFQWYITPPPTSMVRGLCFYPGIRLIGNCWEVVTPAWYFLPHREGIFHLFCNRRLTRRGTWCLKIRKTNGDPFLDSATTQMYLHFISCALCPAYQILSGHCPSCASGWTTFS